MKRQYVMVRITDKTHAKLAAELERLAAHADFGPLRSRFKHSFSFDDVISYLLELQEKHRQRAKQQRAKRKVKN